MNSNTAPGAPHQQWTSVSHDAEGTKKGSSPPLSTGDSPYGYQQQYQQQQGYAALGLGSYPYTPAPTGINSLSNPYNAPRSSPSAPSARRSSSQKIATPPQPPQASPIPSSSARYYGSGPEPHSSPYPSSAPPQTLTHPFSVPGQPPSAHPSYQSYPYEPRHGQWVQYPSGFPHQPKHPSGPSPTVHQSPSLGERPAPAPGYEYPSPAYQQWQGPDAKPPLPMGHWQNGQRLSQSAQPPQQPNAASQSPHAQSSSPMFQQGQWAGYPSMSGVPPHTMGGNGMMGAQPYWMQQQQQPGWQGYYPSASQPAPDGAPAPASTAALTNTALLPRDSSAPAPSTPKTVPKKGSGKEPKKKKEEPAPPPPEAPQVSQEYAGLGKRLSEDGLEEIQDKESGSHSKRKKKKVEVEEQPPEEAFERLERPEKPVARPKSKLHPPKQAPSAWQLFFADELARAKALEPPPDTSPGGTVHPHKFNVANMAKEAGQNYANLSAERKAYYAEKVKIAREQHAKALQAWQATLTPEDVRLENLFRAQQRKEGKSRKGNIKDPNAPKKPLSAYFLFLKAIRENQEIRDQVWGEAVATTKQSILAAEKWRNLTDLEKKPYLEQAELSKQAYEIARKQYEEESAARARGEDIPVRTPIDVTSSPPKPPSSILQTRPPTQMPIQVPLQIPSSPKPSSSHPLSDPVSSIGPLTTPVMATSANPMLSVAPIGISPQEVKPPVAFTDLAPPSPPAGDFKSSIGDVFDFITE
ncbi:hypothetical protein L198_06344 [Cryptococcus wingfieldii CBS 7118]|uniref:HMG box domain-containing protein n=1 Tax=Cryptococcus wingfieldii CBS 7118 TaxID=1295528 RepID=A0A1E3IP03_9TREE|nr:hypothetical protein L198_06344 [Cryptococcus wingfieldii CBS 7118]ODN89656.1 hypothetical protein L198_06344 [Cryptococcus wingfieldii CBS 7118]